MAQNWDYQWLTLAGVHSVGVQQCTITVQPSVTSIAASAASCTQLSGPRHHWTPAVVRGQICPVIYVYIHDKRAFKGLKSKVCLYVCLNTL